MTSPFDWAPPKPASPLDDPDAQAAGGWRHDPRKTLLDFTARHFRGKPATMKDVAGHYNDLATSGTGNNTLGPPDEIRVGRALDGNARIGFNRQGVEQPKRFEPISQDELLGLFRDPEFMDTFQRGRSKGGAGADEDVLDLVKRVLSQNTPEGRGYVPRNDGIPVPGLDDVGRETFMQSKNRSFPDRVPQTVIGGNPDQGYLNLFPSARERFWRRHGSRGSNDGEK